MPSDSKSDFEVAKAEWNKLKDEHKTAKMAHALAVKSLADAKDEDKHTAEEALSERQAALDSLAERLNQATTKYHRVSQEQRKQNVDYLLMLTEKIIHVLASLSGICLFALVIISLCLGHIELRPERGIKIGSYDMVEDGVSRKVIDFRFPLDVRNTGYQLRDLTLDSVTIDNGEGTPFIFKAPQDTLIVISGSNGRRTIPVPGGQGLLAPQTALYVEIIARTTMSAETLSKFQKGTENKTPKLKLMFSFKSHPDHDVVYSNVYVPDNIFDKLFKDGVRRYLLGETVDTNSFIQFPIQPAVK